MERIEANPGRWARVVRIARERTQHLFATEMPAWAFFLDFVVYPPLILLCVYLALHRADMNQVMLSVGFFVVGVLGWTLAEYLIHRFAFHHAPVLKAVHMAHHDAPRALTGTPTIGTVVAFVLVIYWPMYLVAGSHSAAALTAGVMLGYLAYVGVHYIVHHLGSGGSPTMRRLIKLHAVHHHDTEHNFGVTSAFWDRVFGTIAPRK
jgi:sterol desaturase/sphingolipid hydroxylase (fatty acid hydroxylase superfamily)